MDKRIRECLVGQAATEYILPFFWQHGEPHEVLAEEIDAMQRSGIQEFCVESRTHEDFGHEKWWVDMGFMLEEAKKRNMGIIAVTHNMHLAKRIADKIYDLSKSRMHGRLAVT